MVSRKRGRDEMESEGPVAERTEEPSMLQRIRGMWEFASLMQYIFFFGKAVKLEDIDVEDFEDECLKPTPSEKLSQMGLALLKFVSSHKGLTPEIFDEYARRQYIAKAPQRNPFGVEDEPKRFTDFDVFTKIRVLQQLSTWTLNNPNPIRERLDEKDTEQINWRIEPFGWDKEDRTYFVLDDNRLYRRTDAPPPPEEAPKSKAKPRRGGKNTRSNKRRRISRTIPETSPEDEDEPTDGAVNGANGEKPEERMDDFYMQKWELIAVSVDEYNAFLDRIRKSKDPNEKSLVKSILEHVFPILEEQEEERKRKEARRMKELEMMQKLATSKRSSRIAGKMDKIKEQQAVEEAERKRIADLEMAHKEQRKQQDLEQARESRRETREQRLKEREVKRILEEERLQREQELLQKLEEQGHIDDAERARISERKLKADMQKRKHELESLQQDDTWYFDCSVCGKHGQNLDDGTHSIACEKCNVWQHSACHGISEQQAERDDFHFHCNDCKRKSENPIPPIKLKFGKSPTSKPVPPKNNRVHIPGTSATHPAPAPRPGSSSSPMNGMSLFPQNQSAGTHSLVYPGPPPRPPATVGSQSTSSNSPPPARPTSSGPARPGINGAPLTQWQPYQMPHGQGYPHPGASAPHSGYYGHQNQHSPPPPRPVNQDPYAKVSAQQQRMPGQPQSAPRYSPVQHQSPPPQQHPTMQNHVQQRSPTQHPSTPMQPRPQVQQQPSPPQQAAPMSQSSPQKQPHQQSPPAQRPVYPGVGIIYPPPMSTSPNGVNMNVTVQNGGTPRPSSTQTTSQGRRLSYGSTAAAHPLASSPQEQRTPIPLYASAYQSQYHQRTPSQTNALSGFSPGFSPAKHASPKLASSPNLASIAAPVIPPPPPQSLSLSPTRPQPTSSPVKQMTQLSPHPDLQSNGKPIVAPASQMQPQAPNLQPSQAVITGAGTTPSTTANRVDKSTTVS